MEFRETREILNRDEARRTFERQALVTSAIQDIEKEMPDEGIEFEIVFKKGAVLTGLKLPPQYWMRALSIWSQTGWAVEETQFGDSCSVH